MSIGTRTSRWLAVGSVVAATVAAIYLATERCSYVTEANGADACRGLIQTNGSRVLILLAIPVVLSSFGWLSSAHGWQLALAGVVIVLLLYCLVGLASIGLFFVPALILLAASFATGMRSAGDSDVTEIPG